MIAPSLLPIVVAAAAATVPQDQKPPAVPPAAILPPNAKPAYTVQPLPGFAWGLWAQEPLVQDPVSFTIADDGSIYVAESFRQEKGVEDNRSSKFWLEDDLQQIGRAHV